LRKLWAPKIERVKSLKMKILIFKKIVSFIQFIFKKKEGIDYTWFPCFILMDLPFSHLLLHLIFGNWAIYLYLLVIIYTKNSILFSLISISLSYLIFFFGQ
jgi:hypothetical protein